MELPHLTMLIVLRNNVGGIWLPHISSDQAEKIFSKSHLIMVSLLMETQARLSTTLSVLETQLAALLDLNDYNQLGKFKEIVGSDGGDDNIIGSNILSNATSAWLRW